MRESQTAVLERGVILDREVATEPFEVAWATEARWYVQFLETGTGRVHIQTQISADGLTWVDHESQPVTSDMHGVVTTSVHDFGHWLRLVITPEEVASPPLTRVYLALKE